MKSLKSLNIFFLNLLIFVYNFAIVSLIGLDSEHVQLGWSNFYSLVWGIWFPKKDWFGVFDFLEGLALVIWFLKRFGFRHLVFEKGLVWCIWFSKQV